MAATIPKIDITVWRDIKDYYIINCAAGHTHTHSDSRDNVGWHCAYIYRWTWTECDYSLMPTSCRFIQYIQIFTEAVIASAQTYQNRGGSVVSISIDRHLQYTHYGDLTTMLAAFYYTRTAYTHCDMTHLILRLPTIYRPPPGELPRSKRLSHEKQKKKTIGNSDLGSI